MALTKGAKTTLWIFGGIALVGTVWLIRNRYKFGGGDKSPLDFATPYDHIVAIATDKGEKIDNPNGTFDIIYDKKYRFYTNNRVYDKTKRRMGTYDMENIKWDDKTTDTLKSIFNY